MGEARFGDVLRVCKLGDSCFGVLNQFVLRNESCVSPDSVRSSALFFASAGRSRSEDKGQ